MNATETLIERAVSGFDPLHAVLALVVIALGVVIRVLWVHYEHPEKGVVVRQRRRIDELGEKRVEEQAAVLVAMNTTANALEHLKAALKGLP